jgi:hypothetical protein
MGLGYAKKKANSAKKRLDDLTGQSPTLSLQKNCLFPISGKISSKEVLNFPL